MARFRGTVQGGRGQAHRLGHTTSGLHVTASGWGGTIAVRLSDKDGEDWAGVWFKPTNGEGRLLYEGPLNKYRDPRGTPFPLEDKILDPVRRKN